LCTFKKQFGWRFVGVITMSCFGICTMQKVGITQDHAYSLFNSHLPTKNNILESGIQRDHLPYLEGCLGITLGNI
jgi:hypothetical protein